jgi:hypothetical protein
MEDRPAFALLRRGKHVPFAFEASSLEDVRPPNGGAELL